MTDPDKIRAEAVHADPATTGIIPLDSLDPHGVEAIEPEPAPYVQEPLFNKKLMLAWALGAAAVWFAVKFIVPVAIDSAKTAVVESVKEVEANGGTVRIRIDRDKNGRIYNITKIETPAPPAAVATPAAPAIPSKPVPTVVLPPSDAKKAQPGKK